MFNKLQLGTQPASFLTKTKLNSSAALVLLKMMYHVNRLNILAGTPDTIAAKAGMTLWDFTMGIRILKRQGIIRKYTKMEYMLNPDVMFNGNDKQYFIVKHMWETQAKRGLRT